MRNVKVKLERRGRKKHVRDLCLRARGFRDRTRNVRANRATQVQRQHVGFQASRENEVGVEIGIQGNVLRELLTVLKRDWGIPGKFLEVEDKT